MKKCSKCKVEKEIKNFNKHKIMKDGYKNECRECQKKYYYSNREKNLQNMKKWREENHEYDMQRKKKWNLQKEKKDKEFFLRRITSKAINRALKRNKGGKDGESVLQHLPYTIRQLKEHLESQFEDWMTWDNHGTFTYKNGERKWHIDHIIPQSKLPFDSMSHSNFKKCWELENLQPMEAIKNIRLGNKNKNGV